TPRTQRPTRTARTGAGTLVRASTISTGPTTAGIAPTQPQTPMRPMPPVLFDTAGKYGGVLSTNRYLPDSVSNPYGVYGNRFSPLSINNLYSTYGSRYSGTSPW